MCYNFVLLSEPIRSCCVRASFTPPSMTNILTTNSMNVPPARQTKTVDFLSLTPYGDLSYRSQTLY